MQLLLILLPMLPLSCYCAKFVSYYYNKRVVIITNWFYCYLFDCYCCLLGCYGSHTRCNNKNTAFYYILILQILARFSFCLIGHPLQPVKRKCLFKQLWNVQDTPAIPDRSRRIHTEEKAKVIAVSWGTEFLQFLAALAIFHLDDLKNRLIYTKTS